jgi:hypothetical protein
LSQVTLVHAEGSAVAPVYGPPLQLTLEVAPLPGALSVPDVGVEAIEESAITKIGMTKNAGPNRRMLACLLKLNCE